jgi:hypothetical protein
MPCTTILIYPIVSLLPFPYSIWQSLQTLLDNSHGVEMTLALTIDLDLTVGGTSRRTRTYLCVIE